MAPNTRDIALESTLRLLNRSILYSESCNRWKQIDQSLITDLKQSLSVRSFTMPTPSILLSAPRTSTLPTLDHSNMTLPQEVEGMLQEQGFRVMKSHHYSFIVIMQAAQSTIICRRITKPIQHRQPEIRWRGHSFCL
jgi:hypothetical protein